MLCHTTHGLLGRCPLSRLHLVLSPLLIVLLVPFLVPVWIMCGCLGMIFLRKLHAASLRRQNCQTTHYPIYVAFKMGENPVGHQAYRERIFSAANLDCFEDRLRHEE